MAEGIVFDIHRGTTHDGPGMRTTVFFKGCPLRCRWCHNPESFLPGQQLQWDAKRCIGCRSCVAACPEGAVTLDANGLHIDCERCRSCFSCARQCPSEALQIVGRSWNCADLVREACKDEMFFGDFDGGVTVSGGEPTSQPEFLVEFLRGLKARGVHTALDTSGFTTAAVLDAAFPWVDVFLYDIKLLDDAAHRQFTGVSNERILQNLRHLAEKLRQSPGKRLWIRTPLIPGATATTENLTAIGSWIAKEISDVVERWELCAFNSVCKEKYHKLAVAWDYETTPLLTEETVQQLAAAAKPYVGDRLVVSGLTAK